MCMCEKLEVKIKTSNHYRDLSVPKYESEGAAGIDLLACIDDDIIVEPNGGRAVIPTGIFMELPIGYEAQIRPRSGLALKNGITVLNAPGTIDSDYRGEVCVILINLGQDPFVIKRGMRIAQMVFAKYSVASLVEVDELTETVRGKGGFGHSGVQSKVGDNLVSYARAVGKVIEQVSVGKETELQKVLSVTERELKKLYRGRLLLSSTDWVKVVEVCELTPDGFVNAISCQCEVQDESREFVLNLIDAYIDAREALARVSQSERW